ncbi:MAG TPA: alanine dehydrogenase [Thermoanaerobaculia bacterium]|nr:alanine dehydrogenase [Thermoanaerobaculia bacterium]
MRIGVPREIKDHEYRVGIIPAGVHALIESGHEVFIERGAGLGSGIQDEEYQVAGATLLASPEEVWQHGEMIVKVKEPLPPEYALMRPGQVLFTYLHLAPLPELTTTLLERQVTGIAYETITDHRGNLPLLTPMSEVAGRMASLVGAYYLQRGLGGRGTLLGGVPGVPPGDVVILGGGIVGLNSAKVAHGMGARVTILETNADRMRYLDDLFHGAITTLASNQYNLLHALNRADLLIGAVLIPGRSAPKLVTREMLREMKPGAVAVDVAVDQGGCFETTRPTTHSDPVYEVEGVVHYCVANMPGAVPRTSTFALNNATLPFTLALANKGVEWAVTSDPELRNGVNTYKGEITCLPVAESQGRSFTPVESLLEQAAAEPE